MPALNSTTSALLRRSTVSAEQMAQHEGLVRWVTRRQWLGGLPFDDALHEGRIGLWAALRCYDPKRGTAFSTYAVPAIERAIWRAVAIHHRLPSVPHLPPTQEPDPVEEVHRAQVSSALRDLVNHLPPRLRDIVIVHNGLSQDPPETFAAIGRSMGISRQRVHQLHNIAILRLAHPAYSLALRRLLEHLGRGDYRKALNRQHMAKRAKRKLRATVTATKIGR
jgi:RNA polymerase sigma factor (sigma-70 family)